MPIFLVSQKNGCRHSNVGCCLLKRKLVEACMRSGRSHTATTSGPAVTSGASRLRPPTTLASSRTRLMERDADDDSRSQQQEASERRLCTAEAVNLGGTAVYLTRKHFLQSRCLVQDIGHLKGVEALRHFCQISGASVETCTHSKQSKLSALEGRQPCRYYSRWGCHERALAYVSSQCMLVAHRPASGLLVSAAEHR